MVSMTTEMPRDPRPYINPGNGERTSFPHAVSEYRPRDPEVAAREDEPR